MTLRSLLNQLRRTTPAEVPLLAIPPTMAPAERLDLFDAMVDEGARDPLVARSAHKLVELKARARGRALTPTEQLQALLDGMHGLVEYRDDPKGSWDSYSRARATLVPQPGARMSPISNHPRGVGDCEDLAVLFCAMAHAIGFEANCRWLPQPGAPQNHVAAVACDLPEGCVWVETTLPGARVGEHPYEALARLGMSHRLGLCNPFGEP